MSEPTRPMDTSPTYNIFAERAWAYMDRVEAERDGWKGRAEVAEAKLEGKAYPFVTMAKYDRDIERLRRELTRVRTERDRLKGALIEVEGILDAEVIRGDEDQTDEEIAESDPVWWALILVSRAINQREGDPYIDRIAELSEERPVTRLTVKREGGEGDTD